MTDFIFFTMLGLLALTLIVNPVFIYFALLNYLRNNTVATIDVEDLDSEDRQDAIANDFVEIWEGDGREEQAKKFMKNICKSDNIDELKMIIKFTEDIEVLDSERQAILNKINKDGRAAENYTA